MQTNRLRYQDDGLGVEQVIEFNAVDSSGARLRSATARGADREERGAEPG